MTKSLPTGVLSIRPGTMVPNDANPAALVSVIARGSVIVRPGPTNPACSSVRESKGILHTDPPEKLLRSLRDGVFEIEVDPDVASRARRSIDRMLGVTVPHVVRASQ